MPGRHQHQARRAGRRDRVHLPPPDRARVPDALGGPRLGAERGAAVAQGAQHLA